MGQEFNTECYAMAQPGIVLLFVLLAHHAHAIG